MSDKRIHPQHELSPILMPVAEREERTGENRVFGWALATLISMGAAGYSIVEYNIQHEVNKELHTRAVTAERRLSSLKPTYNVPIVTIPVRKVTPEDRIKMDYPPISIPTYMATKVYRYPR